MFKVIYRDLCEFLKNHFLASIVITILYFVLNTIFIEGVFSNPNPLLGYEFFYSSNFVANILLFSMIVSITFFVVLYFEDHRKVGSKPFFSALTKRLPKFICGGFFVAIVVGVVFYIAFMIEQINISVNNDLLAVVAAIFLVLAIILMLKSMILFFPMLYYESDLTVAKTFRNCIRRTSWTITVYYLLMVIILHVVAFLVYYVVDIVNLFKILGLGAEDLIQAYVHVILMVIQISFYKNLIKR